MSYDLQSLAPDNSTPVERALEILTRRLDQIGAPLRPLWNAQNCPINLLPWLAYALSIDAWNDNWPEPVKRAYVAQAIEVQRIKGTAASVRHVVRAFGGALAIREWWNMEPKGAPFTFSVVLTLAGATGETVTARFVEDVVEEIHRTKPARAHFTFTQGLSFTGSIQVVGAVRPTIIRRMEFEQAA